LLLSACEINSGETSSQLELEQLEQRTQVIDYLDNLALLVESGDAILALKQEIDWNSLDHPNLEGKDLVLYSLERTDAYPIRHVLFYRSQDEITYGQILEFAPDGPLEVGTMISNLFRKSDHSYSGLMATSNLLGQTLVENRFSQGEIVSNTRLVRKGHEGKETSSRMQQCVDWYLVTSVGGVVVSESFLYRTCGCETENTRLLGSLCAGGGGGGGGTGGTTLPPNPYNGQEEFITAPNGVMTSMRYGCTDSGCAWSISQIYLPAVVVQSSPIYDFLPSNPTNSTLFYTDQFYYQYSDYSNMWWGEAMKVDMEFLEDPCAREIFSEMLNNALQNPTSDNLFDEILNLLEHSNKFNYRVWDGPLSGKNAVTNKFGSDFTTIFSSTYLNTATTISIVRTMMHEMIHAHLLHLNHGSPGSDFTQSLNAFAQSLGITNLNDIHHEFMPTYIEVISQGLYQWDLANNPSNVQSNMQFYKDLAWGGLTHHVDANGNSVLTAAFTATFPNSSERSRVLNVNNNEQNNTSQAKGTPCPN
jgi:hypothetical protein